MVGCKLMSGKVKSAVITGSEGFIGRALTGSLKTAGHSVTGLDIKNKYDITKMDIIKEKFKNTGAGDVDIVFHLAAKMFIPAAWENPEETFRINLNGTLNMLEFCRKTDIKQFVFASSYIYGEPEYLPIDENHPVKPNNPYAHSKYIAEELCRSYHKDYGLQCVVIRPFNIYGPGQSQNFLIPEIISQLPGGRINLKDPSPKRDYLYLTDMIKAYESTVDLGSRDFEIFNIGSGKSYSVKELAELILTLSGSKAELVFSNEKRHGEIKETIADTYYARKKLHWVPKVGIDDGLKAMLEHQS